MRFTRAGGLTTTGLAEDPNTKSQLWVPVGSGLFVESGGQAQIAFRDGVLLSSVSPTVAYERLTWYQSPALHLILAGVALLILLYAFVAWPIWAVRQRRLGRWQLLARIAGWVTAALAIVFVGLLATALSNAATLNERIMLNDSTLLHTSLVLAKVMVVFVALMLVGAIFAWVRGWWRRPGRIGYTATALAAVAFLGLGAAYNLV